MEYISVSARFLFYNGLTRYTVEYSFGLRAWYIFKDMETTNCVYKKDGGKVKIKDVNSELAELVFYEFIDQKK